MQAQRLHLIYYGLSPDGKREYSSEALQRQVEQCLALLEEADRVVVPGVEVAPPNILRPDARDLQLPTVGSVEGSGLARRREKVPTQPHFVEDPPHPPPAGPYWVYPQHGEQSF